ncbi:antirestriction protein [Photobacterium frigidiphilum]|uniref:Antirestriction protein n=1 Tax=Photobacterium frigidiphilum TaxID=264736 RepID=A0A2T3J7M4_9GAMM|nr:antirestriction protein [Photobacterium frigidiphilum]PSU44771.1 antirestriction protein [Photobacterium frigidiphilum]
MITKIIVNDDKRLNFLPSIAQKYIHFEAAIYHYASKHIEDYAGGYWVFLELSNGGKFLHLQDNGPQRLYNTMNYFEGMVSSEAAGIAISAMVLADFGAIAYSAGDEAQAQRFYDFYYQLRDFALEHNEASEILAFLD